VASFAAPFNANAKELRSVACSVAVDFLFNGAVRAAPYRNEFVVNPGEAFSDDFSTRLRFGFFDASTRLESGNPVVAISYYNDVGVFDAIDFRTELTLHDDKVAESISASHTYSTSQGAAGDRTTNYTLTCGVLKL
jgi:hypothetical protein